MTNYLLLSMNGQEIKIPVELNEEQIKTALHSIDDGSKKTGWDKPENGKIYFYEDALCRIQSLRANESSKVQLDMLYESANCYSSEVVAVNVSRGDALIRKIRRLAIESRENPINFNEFGGYTIIYNYETNSLECGMTGRGMSLGDIVFDTEDAAREVINENAAELTWYFTEMKDSV